MEQSKKTARRSGEKKAQRKPYVKPQCISEPIYETLALACGKLPGQGASCHGAPRRS
jgi:hypothetical protein